MRKYYAMMLSLVILCSVLMVSCSKPAKPVAEEPRDVELTVDRAAYDVPVGKFALVSLTENGSTGYSWHYMIDDESVIAFSEENSKATNSDKNIVGAPNIHTWKFKALKPGATSIKFAYCREWEAKALESKILDNPKLPKLRAFAAKLKASIENREYAILVK